MRKKNQQRGWRATSWLDASSLLFFLTWDVQELDILKTLFFLPYYIQELDISWPSSFHKPTSKSWTPISFLLLLPPVVLQRSLEKWNMRKFQHPKSDLCKRASTSMRSGSPNQINLMWKYIVVGCMCGFKRTFKTSINDQILVKIYPRKMKIKFSSILFFLNLKSMRDLGVFKMRSHACMYRLKSFNQILFLLYL